MEISGVFYGDAHQIYELNYVPDIVFAQRPSGALTLQQLLPVVKMLPVLSLAMLREISSMMVMAILSVCIIIMVVRIISSLVVMLSMKISTMMVKLMNWTSFI